MKPNNSVKSENLQNSEEVSDNSNVYLPPLIREEVVQIPQYHYEEKLVNVPVVEKITRYEPVKTKIIEEKIITQVKPIIEERIRTVPQIVYQDKYVSVPQTKIIDKVVEVPTYIYKEKIIEKPEYVIQERVIPVPKKVVKEKIVELSQEEYRQMLASKSPEYFGHAQESRDDPLVVHVPHTQHSYRHIVTPEYQHIPQPVQVPMTHYKPVPVQKIVDRNVPVPVEIVIVQEYICPRIEPVYKEVEVPIHWQRIIEHPIPKEALYNPHLLPLYYSAGAKNHPHPPGTDPSTPSNSQADSLHTVEILSQGTIPR